MDAFKIRMSIRSKLLLVLTSLPLVCLLLYLVVVTNLFKQDKIAYVFESSVSISKSIATRTRVEMESMFQSLKTIAEAFDTQSRTFPDYAKSIFEDSPALQAVVLFQLPDDVTFVLTEYNQSKALKAAA